MDGWMDNGNYFNYIHSVNVSYQQPELIKWQLASVEAPGFLALLTLKYWNDRICWKGINDKPGWKYGSEMDFCL